MPIRAVELKTKYWAFSQNNSGGSFDIDDARGIGPRVWVEGTDMNDAINRAESVGLYWDGVESGLDCPCCGDRWSTPWDVDGSEEPWTFQEYDFNWHPTVYVHHIDGRIERIEKAASSESTEA